ncbi:hypothetical protein GOV13_03655 [Candidatus Pacearchaeota archaeon]|nr:hypothetical protein [Candidatus Pacearchaeota archaeon]
MTSFLWKKVSEKEKEDIRKQAKGIMDDFSGKLSKVKGEMKEPLIERDEGERKESGEECCDDFSREIMFRNAPNTLKGTSKNEDFIIGERKGW